MISATSPISEATASNRFSESHSRVNYGIANIDYQIRRAHEQREEHHTSLDQVKVTVPNAEEQ
jgi:hypothetical protein